MPIVDADILADLHTASWKRIGCIRELVEQIEECGSASLDLLRQLFRELHTLKSTSSFLELVNVVDLTHATESVVDYLIAELSAGEPGPCDRACIDLLMQVCDKVHDILTSHENGIQISTADLVARLNAFTSTQQGGEPRSTPDDKQPQDERPHASNLTTKASKAQYEIGATPTDARTFGRPEDSGHVDSNVYRISMIQAMRKASGDADAWMVSQLGQLAENVANKPATGGFASALLDVFRGHQLFHKVDRVCLAGVVPSTHQLLVIDSANSVRLGANIMSPGYACFVNPKGSLFQMRPGMLRTFDD